VITASSVLQTVLPVTVATGVSVAGARSQTVARFCCVESTSRLEAGFEVKCLFKLGHGLGRGERRAMGDLKEWLKYWRKVISKCSKIHKDSKAHKSAYRELSGYLNSVEESANDGELDATVLWAVRFMQRMHELEKEIGLHVLGKRVHSTHKE